MLLNEIAGRNIQRIRRKLGLRQDEFKSLCGVTQQYLSSLENGQRNLSLTTLEKIAKTLGVEPAELLRDAGSARSTVDLHETARSTTNDPY